MEAQDKLISTLKRGAPLTTESPVEIKIAKILTKVLRSARSRIDRFELELLSILQAEFDLIACSLYSLNPSGKSLSLRGQVGLAYDDYESFSLSIDSTAGKAFACSEIQVFSNLMARKDYRDQKLIVRFGLDKMVVVPIRFSLDGSERTVCSLCLYPKATSNLSELSQAVPLLENLRDTIEIALQFSLDFTCHLLRHEIVSEALHVSSGASFLHKMLQLLKQWNFEAGSVFLFDSRAMCLRLAATTGLTIKGIPRRNIFYRLTEVQHLTVRSFVGLEESTIDREDINGDPAKYRERLDRDFHSAFVCPFFSPKQAGEPLKLMHSGCLGVIRLVNRQIIHGQQIETAAFTWEDRELVRFLCDILGVVTHLYQRVAQKGNDFERIVHGLESSVLTVSAALHNIEQYVDYNATFPAALKNSVPRSIAFIESIHEQIRVFKLRDIEALERVQLRPIKLYGDVISNIRGFATNSASFHGVDRLYLDIEAFHERLTPTSSFTDKRVRKIPWVDSEADLLLSVFKNLIENAVKYSRDDLKCLIRLDWRVEGNFIEVEVSDAGIGVPPEDEDFIFNEAYQAENAMRRRTIGTGIGLFQCRVIMEKLGGAVRYRRERDDPSGFVTTFIVQIPRSARQS